MNRVTMLSMAVILGAGFLPASSLAGDDAAREADRYVERLKRETTDHSKLARKLLDAAVTIPQNPRLQAALYERAYEYGVRSPSGYPAAAEAAEALLKAAPSKRGQWQEKLLKLYQAWSARARGGEKRQVREKLLGLLLVLGDERLAGGNAAEAAKLYGRALSAAGTFGSPRRTEIAGRLRRANSMVRVQGLIRKYTDRLEKDPGDDEARESLIRICVVELDDPAKAERLLAASIDESWRTYVPLAAKGLDKLPEPTCLELADWYRAHSRRAIGEGKSLMLRRAKRYYERFLRLHTKQDADFLSATKSLAQINDALTMAEVKAKPLTAFAWEAPLGGTVTIGDEVVLEATGDWTMVAVLPLDLGDSYVLTGEVYCSGRFTGFALGYDPRDQQFVAVYSLGNRTRVYRNRGRDRSPLAVIGVEWPKESWERFRLSKDGQRVAMTFRKSGAQYTLPADVKGKRFGLVVVHGGTIKARRLKWQRK